MRSRALFAVLLALGLVEGGIDWALDEDNATLVTPAIRAATEKAKAEIVAVRIVVHDYTKDRRCSA